MNTAAIIQARMGSTRLPGKMMMDICGKPAIERVIERVKQASLVDSVMVAMPRLEGNDEMVAICVKHGVYAYRGSTDDVLGRVYNAAKLNFVDTIVDITGDCPLVDPESIDWHISVVNSKFNDSVYSSNCVPIRSYPDGLDIQVYKFGALAFAESVTKEGERAHCGWNIPRVIDKKYCHCKIASGDYYWPELRITLDTEEDLKLIRNIYQHFDKEHFYTTDIIDYLLENPELLEINKTVKAKLPEEG